MEESEKKVNIDLDSLEVIQDIEVLRSALRLAVKQMRLSEKNPAPVKKGEEANELSAVKKELERAREELNEWRRGAERENEPGLAKTARALADAEEKIRSAEIEKRSLLSRLDEWERKSAEIESARKSFLSLMSRLAEAQKQAAEARQASLSAREEKETAENKTCLVELEREALSSRLNEWEHKAGAIESARKEFLAIISKISGGVEAKEVLMRIMEEKNAAENKARILELEKEACLSRLQEWEREADEIKKLRRELEKRKGECEISEKSLIEKENFLTLHLREMENEYALKRRDLDEFKEKLKKEINGLGRRQEPEDKPRQ